MRRLARRVGQTLRETFLDEGRAANVLRLVTEVASRVNVPPGRVMHGRGHDVDTAAAPTVDSGQPRLADVKVHFGYPWP